MKQIKWKDILSKCFGKKKDERAHAIAMLIIYSVFIFILVVVIRTQPSVGEPNHNTSNLNSNQQTPLISPSPSPTTEEEGPEIESYEINYSYIYTVTNNNQKEVFTGKKLDDKEIFTIISETGSTNYAKLSDNYLLKENGEYHIVDRPSENLIYTDLETIISLVEKGNLVKNDHIYTYSISTSDIVRSYHPDLKLAVEETLRDFVIVTLEEGKIKKIEINFDHYHQVVQNNSLATLQIIMEFNDIGTTQYFDVTVSN
ncbi:MAG: hypothetical protein PUB18_02280 [bacterium]|nr:hypothetical protein [bacterium]